MKLVAVALLTFAIATPTYAFDGHDWGWTRPRAAVHQHHPAVNQHHRYRHLHRMAHLYRESERDIRHEEGRRFEEESHGDERHCLDHFEEVVSTEHTESGDGMTAAHKLWSARVQWYFGSRMMNPDNAKDAKFVCDQSNAMDTITGRIIDNVEKLAGHEGKNQRCVFRAIPCAAPLERVEKAEEHHDHEQH
jgi:hypothetical protein